jgi:hypothetical protein
MNKQIKLLVATFCMLAATASAQTKKAVWPQMKTFHSFMASTFHPAEDGNLAPLKQKADSLEITAKLWQASAIPANYKPAETKAALENLVAKADAINKAVAAKERDDVLKKLITEAHEIFHHIVGECKNADE